MVEVTGKGSLLSMKVVYHPTARGDEEEAILDPTCMIRRAPLVGSLITTATVVGARGVLVGVSSSLLWVYLVWQGLLRLRGGRGGCSLFWGCCSCTAGWPPGRNRSAVMFLRTIISSSASLALTCNESIDSTSTYSTASTLICCSSTDVCKAQPWKTVLANPSLIGTNEQTFIKRGPRSWASLTISLGGKNSRCRTSIYDNNGLPIVKACPEGW